MNSTPDPQTDRPRALHLLEAADFVRDAHFRDGLSVQEIGTALRHMADAADPMVGSLARDGFGLDEIAAMPVAPAAVPPTGQTGLRERIAQAIADALKPRYGGPQHNTPGGLPLTATAEELRLHRAQPLADAVLSVLPADSEPHRLALSTALGLGTSAPWDAIRERAAELVGRGGAGGGGGIVAELNRRLNLQIEMCGRHTAEITLLRRKASQSTPVAPSAATPNGTGGGVAASEVRAVAYRGLADQQTQLAVADDLARRRDVAGARRQLVKELRRLAAETPGPETHGAHSCGNCEGIDPDSCLMNPDRPRTNLFARSGISTPGCDCGHDGMGVRWHGQACVWVGDLVAEARQLLAAEDTAPAVVAEPGKENGRG